MNVKKIIRECILSLICLSAIIFAVFKFSEATLPYRDGYGCLWRQYALEQKDSVDIMFFGSSLAYCNAIPSVIYEETGYSAYVMAGPQLTVKQTYYYMREAFKTQSPKLVFLETAGMFFSEYTDYSRINVGYMPFFSMNRIKAALFAVESEEKTGALFPPYNYHDLWPDYFDAEKKEEFNKKYSRDLYAGFTFLKETVAQDEKRDRSLTNYTEAVYAANLETLKKIARLCEKEGAALILYSTPMYKPLNDEYYEMLKTDAVNIAEYIDFNAQKHDIGLDMENDFYDIFHLNFRGAVKFSEYIAPVIESYNIPKTRHDGKIWVLRAERLESRIESSGGL